MDRTTLRGGSLAAIAVVLASCRLLGELPTTPLDVVAGTDPAVAAGVVSIAAGGERWVRIEVPAPLRGSDLRLVLEADDGGGTRALDVVMYDGGGVVPLASTSGRAYFRPGLAGIGGGFATEAGEPVWVAAVPAASSMDGQSVSADTCRGPCLARGVPSTLALVHLLVRNRGTTAHDVPIHAYVHEFLDAGEPLNDDASGAMEVAPGADHRGALERLGDVDWVLFTHDGTVSLTERPGHAISARLSLFAQAQEGGLIDLQVTIHAGGTLEVEAGDLGRIESDPDDPRASVYGFYDVAYE